MHDPIEHAKERIRGWGSGEPLALVAAVAELCRETLDRDGLPEGSPGWRKLRESFDEASVLRASDPAQIVCEWDAWVRSDDLGDDLLDDRGAAIKLGVVTFLVKLLARQLGLLKGSDPCNSFDEWKARLCESLDRYVGPFRD